ncbi:transglutaminase domain-containing protein [Phycicoccus endophyticus]|uniref:Transglutaminase domain-containing protein n=1 Tax=Phycicoccus endophyticus TaxID=1690220 RepID=A0A7G9R556_9MICO|nr:transglutaminase-like domain-containing protein [Phycicoccus endophyticus]QNN50731.1 transglutaminase domain-containing protein [Phycicoccus endophyticus]
MLENLTDAGDTPLEVATAIQDYLRGSDFTYSEELAEDTGQGLQDEEPLVRFLDTRRGYCVQFASAMVMLAREAGIPARMAVGFLPGTVDGDQRVVRVTDAHAWPELWFPELGWMRFEPTPGVRSGLSPAYTRESTTTEGSASPEPTSSATSTGQDSTRPEEDLPADAPEDVSVDTGSTGVLQVLVARWPTLLGVLAVLVLGALTPLGAWLSRRRARTRDDAGRLEAQWQSLLLRLGDVGLVPRDGATPRQASRELSRAAYLDAEESAALASVVEALEQARYAPPGAPVPDVSAQVRTVWRGALGRRRRVDRLRALLLPEEGRRHWRSVLRLGRRGGPESGAPPERSGRESAGAQSR